VTRLPLAGVTVVAIEQAVAAPFASRQLADLGARVIKVERAAGDFARDYDRTVHGLSSYFVWLNRGKESIVLDLKAERDVDVLRELVRHSDVLIQNLAPGAIERIGLGPDAALELNPRLIHASITGYGRGGDYATKKAYDLLVQCEAGLLDVTGTPEAGAKVGISIADIAAGMYAYTGVLTALLQRGITGLGDVIEVSMLDALGEWMTQPYLFAEYSGASPRRSGAAHASIAPYGPVDVRDGRVFLAIQNPREWVAFCCNVLEDESLATDPRFSDNTARVDNRGELDRLVADRLQRSGVAELTAQLDSAGIANARLRTMNEFSHHPQLKERDRWRDITTPAGPVRVLLPPVVSRSVTPQMGAVPMVGEHTAAILAELSRQ